MLEFEGNEDAGVGVAPGEMGLLEGGRRRRERMAWRGGRMSKVEGGGNVAGGEVGAGMVARGAVE